MEGISDFIKTPELDPIALFHRTKLSRWQYAEILGVSKTTIDLWCSGRRNPSRPIRRLAAELAEKWNNSEYSNQFLYERPGVCLDSRR